MRGFRRVVGHESPVYHSDSRLLGEAWKLGISSCTHDLTFECVLDRSEDIVHLAKLCMMTGSSRNIVKYNRIRSSQWTICLSRWHSWRLSAGALIRGEPTVGLC